MDMSKFSLFLSILFLWSCSSLPKYQLKDDYYNFHQPGKKPTKVFVRVNEDTVKITGLDDSLIVAKEQDEYFVKRSFDLDAMTVLFKYRPSAYNLPRQLNTSFNGNVYLGYRIDRFWLDYKKNPGGVTKELKHKALTLGAFGGLGTAAINPSTTNYRTTDEYDGLVLTRGFAIMVGLNSLTVGLGVGWDNLTDRDKDIWIYQNRPWYGLTLGLNIN